MDRLSNFEIGKSILQEFVNSNKVKTSHIFYSKIAKRLAICFPNLKLKNLGKTPNCWTGQYLYRIEKR